jgi:hypothetical protein
LIGPEPDSPRALEGLEVSEELVQQGSTCDRLVVMGSAAAMTLHAAIVAAVFDMRPALHDGQLPRSLHENVNSSSSPQISHTARARPCACRPHSR